jgi:hypothetical protein
MLGDACGVTDLQTGRVDEADPGAVAELGGQIDGQGQHDTGHEGNKAGVADQLGELGAQLGLDILGVDALEGAVA